MYFVKMKKMVISCNLWTTENTTVPSTRYDGYFFNGDVKKTESGSKKFKFFPIGIKCIFYVTLKRPRYLYVSHVRKAGFSQRCCTVCYSFVLNNIKKIILKILNFDDACSL